jgi:hypothetical protein
VLSGLFSAKQQKSKLNTSPLQTRPSEKSNPGQPFTGSLNAKSEKRVPFPFFIADTQTLPLQNENNQMLRDKHHQNPSV